MPILIGGKSFHHVDADDRRVRVHGGDKHAGDGGDQVFVGSAPHLIDLVGGIVEHCVQPAQLRAGGVVHHGAALQLGVEILSRREAGVGAADGDALALQREGVVHGVHAGEGQEHGGFVDAGGPHRGGLPADVEGFEGGDELRVEAGGVHLYLAADAVGVDHGAHGDKFGTHRTPSC